MPNVVFILACTRFGWKHSQLFAISFCKQYLWQLWNWFYFLYTNNFTRFWAKNQSHFVSPLENWQPILPYWSGTYCKSIGCISLDIINCTIPSRSTIGFEWKCHTFDIIFLYSSLLIRVICFIQLLQNLSSSGIRYNLITALDYQPHLQITFLVIVWLEKSNYHWKYQLKPDFL